MQYSIGTWARRVASGCGCTLGFRGHRTDSVLDSVVEEDEEVDEEEEEEEVVEDEVVWTRWLLPLPTPTCGTGLRKRARSWRDGRLILDDWEGIIIKGIRDMKKVKGQERSNLRVWRWKRR